MKTTNILVYLFFFSLFSFNTVHAEQCFPQGSITVSLSGSIGQTAHAEISPMGAITIDYPNGPLRGHVDSLGHFTASNDYTTVTGNVDTSCAKVQNLPIDTQGCLIPVTKDCDANALGGISVQQNMFGIGNTAMGAGAIQACKDTHTQYQNELNTYKTCLNTNSQSQPVSKTWGPTRSEIESKQQQADTITKNQQACFAKNGLYRENNGSCFCKSGESFNEYGACAPTPSPAQQSSCPLNAYLGNDNFCHCNVGFGVGSGNDDSKCVSRDLALQEYGVVLYGSEVHYNATTNNFDCNDGYLFENGTSEKNNKCIPIKDWCKKNNSNSLCNDSKINTNTKITPNKVPLVANTITRDIKINQKGLIKKTTVLTSTSTFTATGTTITNNMLGEKQISKENSNWKRKITNFFSSLFGR